MQNENIRLRRGYDLSSRSPPPPQGVGAPNMGFRSTTKGTQWNEVSSTPNIITQPHVLNAVIMDEPVELQENMEEQEIFLQEYLDAFGFEDSSFLFNTDEMYNEG